MQIKANEITFNYQIDGAQGAPWLIFSNSLATNLSMWDDQARAFSGRFRVLRYDQRGHGKTEAPEGRYPFATLLADAIALMDALEIARAHFCGLSLGGATALGLTEQYPNRIVSTIVCDSPCASTPASAKQWEERLPWPNRRHGGDRRAHIATLVSTARLCRQTARRCQGARDGPLDTGQWVYRLLRCAWRP